MLRSPEVAIFAQMATSEIPKEAELDLDNGILIEICEDNVIIGMEGSGAVSLSLPNCQLLHAANYTNEGIYIRKPRCSSTGPLHWVLNDVYR
ncbi:unnamed protein product [Diatraea saccharalis]|uniref:Uncharacterized protein n=1 Tax=Diatraea saccharalis TaxID=40085 RepID=A0A9N9QVM1_9NEOP|nr:unnamed protein product [Diatraea saccharalis]